MFAYVFVSENVQKWDSTVLLLCLRRLPLLSLCCILSGFLCVHLPQSLPHDLYRPLRSHPSCPLLHSDSESVGRRGQRGRSLSGGVWKTRCFLSFYNVKTRLERRGTSPDRLQRVICSIFTCRRAFFLTIYWSLKAISFHLMVVGFPVEKCVVQDLYVLLLAPWFDAVVHFLSAEALGELLKDADVVAQSFL